jgi:hypothetical protein
MDNDMGGDAEEHAVIIARMNDIDRGTIAGTQVANSASNFQWFQR